MRRPDRDNDDKDLGIASFPVEDSDELLHNDALIYWFPLSLRVHSLATTFEGNEQLKALRRCE